MKAPGATTSSGRNLHKDDPIEAWDEAAARINAYTASQGREVEPDLTGETLRRQTMLADEILAEILAEPTLPESWIWQSGRAVRPRQWVGEGAMRHCLYEVGVDQVDHDGNVSTSIDDGGDVECTNAPAEVYAAILRKAGWTVVPPGGAP